MKKLEPQGEKFDPNFHQAMFEMPDETLPSGTVTKVVQSGWTIGERVLRPAMVGVSKGGPKPVEGGVTGRRFPVTIPLCDGAIDHRQPGRMTWRRMGHSAGGN